MVVHVRVGYVWRAHGFCGHIYVCQVGSVWYVS